MTTIVYERGDITKTHLEHIIHGCNAQGVMGSGVAKAIRAKWPEAYDHYVFTLNLKTALSPHRTSIIETKDGKTIGNLVTQQYYGRDGKRYANPDWIRDGIEWFIKLTDATEIASPKIGCGYGGLNWKDDVLSIYENISRRMGVKFRIYDI